MPTRSGSPTFSDAYINSATATRLVATDGDKKIVSVANLKSWLAEGANITITDNLDGTVTIAATGGGVSDHGALSGLGDDDHTQYHTDARGDARYYTETELDAGQLDNRYFTESEHINSSAGAGDAGKPIKLDAAGQIDSSMIASGGMDPSYAEMFIDENTTAEDYFDDNDWNLLKGPFETGALLNWTFSAGYTVAIGSVSNVGGTARFNTSGAHSLSVDDVVSVSTSVAGYNELYVITAVPTITTFETGVAYSANASGRVTRGGQLIAGADSGGLYHCTWNASWRSSSYNSDIKGQIAVNTTRYPKTCSYLEQGASNEYLPLSGQGLLTIAEDDVVSLAWMQMINKLTETVYSASVVLVKIAETP